MKNFIKNFGLNPVGEVIGRGKSGNAEKEKKTFQHYKQSIPLQMTMEKCTTYLSLKICPILEKKKMNYGNLLIMTN